SGRRGSNPRPTAWKAVTLPLSYSRLFFRRCRERGSGFGIRSATSESRLTNPVESQSRIPNPESRHATIGGEGRTRTFEAARATDLQSAAFDRFATSPTVCVIWKRVFSGRLPCCRWSWRRDLNPRPADYKSAALPTELRQLKQKTNFSTSCATRAS